MLGETFVERLRAARLPAKPYSIVLCARLVKGESIFSFLISHLSFQIRLSTFHIRHSTFLILFLPVRVVSVAGGWVGRGAASSSGCRCGDRYPWDSGGTC